MARILIVEDEPNMVAGLRDNFEYEGYEVITAPDGVAGLERALNEAPDLVILDVMMPRMSGLDVCKQLKSKRPSVPIIMLTARGQEVDKVVGLELGADDYVTKPFVFKELMARVRAVLRRHGKHIGDVLTFRGVTLNRATRVVTREERLIDLTPREFELLEFFLMHPRQVLKRDAILAHIWGYNYVGDDNVIEVYVRHLAPPYPARTTVAVRGLPRGALVEIECIAQIGERGEP